MRCRTHCPEPGGGVLAVALAVLAALVAVAVFVVTHVLLVLGCAAVTAAGTFALHRLFLAHTVQQAPFLARARARAALPAASVAAELSVRRLAIEPHRVIPGVVISDEQEVVR